MRRKPLWSVGAILGGLLLLALFSAGSGTRQTTLSGRTDVSSRTPATAQSVPGADPARATEAAADRTPVSPSGSPRGLYGRVVDSTGKPVPSAMVKAYRLTRRSFDRMVPFPKNPLIGLSPQASSSSAEDGRFQLSGLSSGTVRLTASHAEGLAPLSPPYLLQGGRPTGPITLTLVPLFSLKGIVVDRQGARIRKAEVTLLATNDRSIQPRRTVVDEDGRFEIPLPGGRHALWVVAHGYIPMMFSDLQAPGSSVRLILLRGGGISGTVSDHLSGRPVAGARVEGMLGNWNETVRSNAQGAFSFSHAPAGEALLTVTHAGHAPAQHSVRTRRGVVVPTRVTLRAGYTLSGQILAKRTAQPISNGTLIATAQSAPVRSTHRARLDDDGRFEMTGLTKGAWTIQLSIPGYTLPAGTEVFVHADRDNHTTLHAVKTATLSGTVTGSDGVGLTGVSIRIVGDSEIPQQVRATHTAQAGEFTLEVPNLDTTFHLRLSHPEHVELTYGPLRLSAGQNKQQKIRMPSAATVHGQTLGPDGAPVPGALLTLFAFSSTGETQSEVGRLASDRSGSFQFRRLHPGTAYQMRVEAAGLRTRYSRPFRLGEARDLRLDQRLSAGTTLTGRILRPDGEPIIGAVLQAVDQHSGQYVGRSRTDEKGAFRFDSLTEGPFGVSAFAPGYTEISLGDVRAGSDLALEMTLERTVSLEVDLPQDYHFEYTVKLFRLGTDSDHPTLSQSFPPNQRRHTLGPLPEGRYKLVAEGPGLTPAHIETIRALGEGGQVQYLQLRLGRMIVGTLVDSDGQPINGAYILRGQVPANVSSREAQSRGLILEATHPDGSFHLTGFEGAQARITIMHDEYLTQTVNVNVGQSTSNRIQLVRGHLLKVQLTGSALSARQLRLEGPVVRETLSNPTGEAHFAGLMPGSYTIRIDGKPVKHSAIEIPKLTSIQLASSK